MKKKALVTGGAGFIGLHLVEELVSQQYDVYVIDFDRALRLKKFPAHVRVEQMDICSNKITEAFHKIKPNLVFHLAAQADVSSSLKTPQYDAQVNINGTINLLEASRSAGVEKFIFSSTSAVYGNLQKSIIAEEDRTMPISYYGLSKLTAERYIELFSQLYRLPFTILRYGNVYGPRQTAKGEGGVIAVFLEKIKNGEPLIVHGDGEQTRDFVFVKDVAQANLAAINKGDQQIVNISTATPTSINQLIQLMQSLHDHDLSLLHEKARQGDIRHSRLNNKKAKKVLEWEPRTTIAEGIKETYEYVMKEARKE